MYGFVCRRSFLCGGLPEPSLRGSAAVLRSAIGSVDSCGTGTELFCATPGGPVRLNQGNVTERARVALDRIHQPPQTASGRRRHSLLGTNVQSTASICRQALNMSPRSIRISPPPGCESPSAFAVASASPNGRGDGERWSGTAARKTTRPTPCGSTCVDVVHRVLPVCRAGARICSVTTRRWLATFAAAAPAAAADRRACRVPGA